MRWRAPVICLALAAITFAVFGQTLRHDFVYYDDNEYVYENPMVARGLTRQGIVWAFTSVHAYNWHPLTWLSHMLDCQFYGLHSGGHHLTNVLLHTATVIALFLVLRQMTGALWRSAFVAAVFAIHPLRAESVAWVAERKDVLSGLFFMLTIAAYVRYVGHPWSLARYALVVFLFAMGLMSKPMLVTLPVVLLLLDFWPLRRTESVGKLVMEKLPLLLLSAAGGAATLLAQHGTIQSTVTFSLPLRLANALVACMIYLRQMVWPAGLAAFYPYRHGGFPKWEVALAGALLAGFSGIAWRERRKQPWLLAGWLWYLVMLLPVLGIVQVGSQSHADRYTYFPQIGIYFGATWLIAEWGAKWRVGHAVLGAVMTVVIAGLMFCAWKQTAYWKNGEILWNHTLACTTGNNTAEVNLGNTLGQVGRTEEAIGHYQKALQIDPNDAGAHNNLGIALFKQGMVDEAIAHFRNALQLHPDYAEAHFNLGNVFLHTGKPDEAIACFQDALHIRPDYAEAHYNLGIVLSRKGNLDQAIDHYQRALQINPAFVDARNNLGTALFKEGQVDQAITQFQQSLRIEPDDAAAHLNLGNILLQQGRVDEAIGHYQNALQTKPSLATAHYNMGNALRQKGKIGEAIAQYQNALQIDPNDPQVLNILAWLLATCSDVSLRNGSKAVELARQANALSGGSNPIFLRTMAAALAETGQFGGARESEQKAIELARAAGRQDLAAQFSSELKRYEAGLPIPQ